MKAINTLKATLVATAFAALCSGQALADAPSYVRLRSLTYAGTGCPQGTVATRISADRESATLLFDSFVAEVGPGVPFREKRKNCQINIDLDHPSGWSYAVASYDYSGYVALDRSVKASLQTSFYFQGQGQTATLRSTMYGPTSRDFRVRDSLGSSQVWSPCGAQRSLNVNTQVTLDNSANSRGHGLLAIDSERGDLPSGIGNLRIVWQRCR